MLNKKKSIMIGCVILVILLLLITLAIVENKKKGDEDLPVENNSNHVITEEEDEKEVVEITDKDSSELKEDPKNDPKNDPQGGSEIKHQGKEAEVDSTIPADKNSKDQAAVDKLSYDDTLSLLCSTDWYEIGKYTYLAIRFSEDGTFNLWDTAGNPGMKGDFSIDTESMQITLDCSKDEDFDPPFNIPRLSVCSYYFTKEGYLCIKYQKDQLQFRLKENVQADKEIQGFIWNAVSASDGSDVNGLKLDLGNYFALYKKDTIYFVSEMYKIGTKKGYITVNWSGYGNDDGKYQFFYSKLPYVKLGFWDLSDKTLSIEDATSTFEEDMNLQLSYTFNNDSLEIEYEGVAITFTRGEASEEADEAIYQKLIE